MFSISEPVIALLHIRIEVEDQRPRSLEGFFDAMGLISSRYSHEPMALHRLEAGRAKPAPGFVVAL